MMKTSKLNLNLGLCAAIAAGTLVVGCGNSGSSSSGGSTPTPVATVATPLTIDNAGIVPVLGDSPTSSVIYVHNNSKETISGISYKALLNTGEEKFLDANSAALCATIPAEQSCPLVFTTPAISKTVAQGSAVVSASYNLDKQAKQFSQVISFVRVDGKVAKGAQFNSGVQLNGAGNSTAYGTVYLYGSGENKICDVNSITSSSAAVKIIQGNISGKQLSSNYVSAVEVSAPSNAAATPATKSAKAATSLKLSLNADSINPATYYATLTAASSLGSASYSSTSDIGVNPAANGAILTAGNVPIVDSSVASSIGTLYIVNAGNGDASVGTVTTPDGVTITNNSCGNSAVAARAMCAIQFTVPNAGGSGDIAVPYSGAYTGDSATLNATVTWYNSKNEALLQMTSSQNPITFDATVGQSTIITIRNVGGYDLTGVGISPTTVSNSGSATTTTQIACLAANGTDDTTPNLKVGGTCSYTQKINNNTVANGTALFTVTGSYIQTSSGTSVNYQRKLSVPYTSNAYRATLVFNPSPIVMPAIYGDGVDFKVKTVTVTNAGAADATVGAAVLINNPPSYLTIADGGTCAAALVLAHNDTCTINLKVGPTSSSESVNATAGLQLAYTGEGQIPNANVEGTINYTVLPNSQNLVLTDVAASGSGTITGDGASANVYQIAGYTTDNKITLTYTNTGTNAIQIGGINNTNSPIAWQIDPGASSCSNAGVLPSAEIAVNGTCTIVFNNVLANYAVAVPAGVGATFAENIVVPEIIFFDSISQFVVRPAAPSPISDTTIYVTGNQATIANAASFTDQVLTVSHTLTNATGYSALTVTASMEDYFLTSPAPIATNCTVATDSGVMTQTCTLDPAGGVEATASVAYTANSAYIGETLHVLFKLITSGYVVSFTPLSATATMP